VPPAPSTRKKSPTLSAPARSVRADAQRSLDALLEAAKSVFSSSGVDAPVREIAARAGVGVATVYRHFPERSALVAAVFRREIDACAAAASALAREHEPVQALALWLRRYTSFIATKRGLAGALHSGDATFASMPAYFEEHVGPALQKLLRTAAAAGGIRSDVDAMDVLRGVSNLCVATDELHSQRMVALLLDGLRFGAEKSRTPTKRATSRPARLRRG
jgi:AcrR family transcriptional regulator